MQVLARNLVRRVSRTQVFLSIHVLLIISLLLVLLFACYSLPNYVREDLYRFED